MGPNPTTGNFIRREECDQRHTDTGRMPSEDRGGGWGRCTYEPRTGRLASSRTSLEEARKGLPLEPSRECGPADTLILDPASILKSPNLW